MVLIVLGAWVVLAGRLIWIQGIRHSHYIEEAEDQYLGEIEIAGIRGTIFDCNGQPLATDLPHFYAIGANPSKLLKDRSALTSIAKALGVNVSHLRNRLTTKSRFVWVDRGVDESRANKVKRLNIAGVRVDPEPKRTYVHGSLAGQLLGATDCDRIGIAGLEHYFDTALRDERRKVQYWTDALGQIKVAVDDRQAMPRGHDITLTIDIVAQTIVEEELANAVQTYKAEFGMAIMTEPRTGKIIAMATYPAFDPNHPENAAPNHQRCRPVTDMFEPGSTFKIVVSTAALESGKVSPEKVFFCENGHAVFGKRVFRDAHPHGNLTFREIFSLSSNIGMAKIGQEVGADLLYKTARDFGFGEPTGVALDGEARGIVHQPRKWSGSTLSNFCIGQGVSVTALQLAMAYSSIANGGDLLQPRIIQCGDADLDQKPIKIRRVFSSKTCETLRKFMVDVVKTGTGKTAAIEGVTVAGKTGTAQKVDTTRNTYYQNRFVSSFVGFLPAEDPKYLTLVIIDDPRGQYYGSQVAAPAFKNIMQRWMAAETSTGAEFVSNEPSEDEGEKIPKAAKKWGTKTQDAVAIDDAPNVMPEVIGTPIRTAVSELTKRGMNVSTNGRGNVKRQNPSPGTAIEPGMSCQLVGEISS
jgi:cell division protein FtsI (penicillin-binding protein 3)